MNRTPLPELTRVLMTLGSYGHRLNPAEATYAQLDDVARALDEARRLLTAARSAGCARHPGAPTDPTDGDRCLFCPTRRSATVTDTPTAVVLADLTEHGEEETARRHGARAVTLALASAGRGTHRYPPNQRPNGRDQKEGTP